MAAGFVLLPILWLLQDNLLFFGFGFGSPSDFDLINYFLAGAIPGAILGAGVSKAALAWRQGDSDAAKWHLLCHGAAVLTLISLLVAPTIWSDFQTYSGRTLIFGFPVPPWLAVLGSSIITTNFPLHCAFLMLVSGILMRSHR
ncbi:MAG: hypothetical protein KY445_10500 [Armatimonadetes bacterium]|nr:hypothetical protein [Armatimonadota bacterium]